MIKSSLKFMGVLILTTVLATLLTACGGSDGGDGGIGAAIEPDAQLTTNNSPQVASAVTKSINLTEIGDLLGGIGDISALSASHKLENKGYLYKVLSKLITIPKTQIISDGQLGVKGTVPSTTEACSGGGTVIMSATWTGPDIPQDASQISDLEATLTFSSCKEGTATINGTASFTFAGTLDNPTGFTFSSLNFTFADSSTGDNITMTNFSLVITSPDLTGSTIMLSGAISGIADNLSIIDVYENLTIDHRYTQNGDMFTLSGRMRPVCLDGWITINTSIDIFVPANADCPSAGEIIITSAGDNISVVMESDSTISIYFNGTLVQTYGDCTELEGLCSS